MNTNIKKVHTSRDLVVSLGLIIIGIGLYFVNPGCAVCIGALGILLLFLYRVGYRIGDDKTVYHKRSVDLCRGCKEPLVDFLEDKAPTLEIKEGADGGCIRVDFFYTDAKSKSYVQLYDFLSYEYHKDGDLREVPTEKTPELLKKL